MEQFVKAYNEDGRDFIRASVTRMKEWHDTQREIQIQSKKWVTGGSGNKKYLPPPEIIPIPEKINHFLMNLPATAVKFLGSILSKVTNVRCLSWRISRSPGIIQSSDRQAVALDTCVLFSTTR